MVFAWGLEMQALWVAAAEVRRDKVAATAMVETIGKRMVEMVSGMLLWFIDCDRRATAA